MNNIKVSEGQNSKDQMDSRFGHNESLGQTDQLRSEASDQYESKAKGVVERSLDSIVF